MRAIDMTMGHGTPTIQEALDHGFRPSLSSDHGAHRAGHVLADAGDLPVPASASTARRRAATRTRRRSSTAAICWNSRPSPARVARRSTRKVGTLTPGKDADIVMLRADRLDIWPLSNAYGTVVNFMHPGSHRRGVHRRQGEEMAR